MPTDLRERLKALVEEWRDLASKTTDPDARMVADTRIGCADDLEDILAESESEPHASHGPESCWRCADDAVKRERLPLGHRYRGQGRVCNLTISYSADGQSRLRCGQPRSAHEPKPSPEPGE